MNITLYFLLLYAFSKNAYAFTDQYVSTKNISVANFEANITSSKATVTRLECANQCSWLQKKSGTCNSYHYDEASKTCKMAKLGYLEDPLPGEASQQMMINTGVLSGLEMRCRGGHHCCAKYDDKCGEGKNFVWELKAFLGEFKP